MLKVIKVENCTARSHKSCPQGQKKQKSSKPSIKVPAQTTSEIPIDKAESPSLNPIAESFIPAKTSENPTAPDPLHSSTINDAELPEMFEDQNTQKAVPSPIKCGLDESSFNPFHPRGAR